MSPRHLTVLALFALWWAPPAEAILIDNFEHGGVELEAQTAGSDEKQEFGVSGVIGFGDRFTTLAKDQFSNSGTLVVDVNATGDTGVSGQAVFTTTTGSPTGDFSLAYGEGRGFGSDSDDLTDGGTSDRFRILYAGNTSHDLYIRVIEGGDVSEKFFSVPDHSTTTTVPVPFSDLPNRGTVDFSQIDELTFIFFGGNTPDVRVKRIDTASTIPAPATLPTALLLLGLVSTTRRAPNSQQTPRPAAQTLG